MLFLFWFNHIIMKKRKQFLSFFLFFFATLLLQAQGSTSITEKLGYPVDAKLLIIHADDLGVAHSVNQAGIELFEQKGITSGSIMVPCPWFTEFAEYAKKHQELDLGIHLTLTAEWDNYKWGGVMPANEIPSLLNEKGFFYATVEEFGKNARAEEVEKEIRAQIERALAFGVNPTHIDTHMGSVMANPEFLKIYLSMEKEYGIPVFVPGELIPFLSEELLELLGPDPLTIDQMHMLSQDGTPGEWFEGYRKIMEDLKPGLNEIIIHPGIDNAELQAVTIDHPDFGAAWRQRDLDVFLSDEMKSLIKEYDIQLITWKEITEILKADSK